MTVKLTAVTMNKATSTTSDYGFLIEDDNAATFVDTLLEEIEDDGELMRKAILEGEKNPIIKQILDTFRENQTGIMINGAYYDYSEIENASNMTIPK